MRERERTASSFDKNLVNETICNAVGVFLLAAACARASGSKPIAKSVITFNGTIDSLPRKYAIVFFRHYLKTRANRY